MTVISLVRYTSRLQAVKRKETIMIPLPPSVSILDEIALFLCNVTVIASRSSVVSR